MQGPIRTVVCAIVTAIASASTILPANAAVIIDSLMIRVYDTAGVLARDRARAMRVAERVLASGQVYVQWRDCTPNSAARLPAECEAVPATSDLLVRITRSPAGTSVGAERALGYSLIDTASGRGTLATIYIDRVDWLAGEARAPRAALLGRAIAHELGHLVLGSNAHSGNGLMRAVWTAAEVARDRSSDWMFSADNRAVLLNARVGGAVKPAS